MKLIFTIDTSKINRIAIYKNDNSFYIYQEYLAHCSISNTDIWASDVNLIIMDQPTFSTYCKALAIGFSKLEKLLPLL